MFIPIVYPLPRGYIGLLWPFYCPTWRFCGVHLTVWFYFFSVILHHVYQTFCNCAFIFTRWSNTFHFRFRWLISHVLWGVLQVALHSLRSFSFGFSWMFRAGCASTSLGVNGALTRVPGFSLYPEAYLSSSWALSLHLLLLWWAGVSALGSLYLMNNHALLLPWGSLFSVPSMSHPLNWWFSD